MTANQFAIAVCTASKVINQVTKTFAYVLGPNLIKLPENTDEMREVAEFGAQYGMMQCFGCIDGTYIKNPSSFRKFSLNVQAVCNYRGLFLDVDCSLVEFTMQKCLQTQAYVRNYKQ